jgi:hypothetical protein
MPVDGNKNNNQNQEIIARLIAIQSELGGKRVDTPPEKIPLIDPTANVLQLVNAAMNRQDDLRKSEARRQDELAKIREQCAREDRKAQAHLAKAESKRVDALALAESRRIDAVLAQLRADAALANEKTTSTAATMALQVSTVAETLRAQQAMTTATTAAQIETLRKNFEDQRQQDRTTTDARVTLLERSRYEIGGRDEQRGEGRQNNQWLVGVVVVLVAAVLGILADLLLRR